MDVQFYSCECPRAGRQKLYGRRRELGRDRAPTRGAPTGCWVGVEKEIEQWMFNFTPVSVLARGDRNCMVAGENWGVTGHPQGVPLRIVEQVWGRKLHSGCAILILWVSTYGETKIARSQARLGGVPGHPQGVPLRIVEQVWGRKLHSGCAILILWVSTYGETKIARSQARLGGVPGHPQGVPLRIVEQVWGRKLHSGCVTSLLWVPLNWGRKIRQSMFNFDGCGQVRIIFYFIVLDLRTPRLLPTLCGTHELAAKARILRIAANAGKLGASFSC